MNKSVAFFVMTAGLGLFAVGCVPIRGGGGGGPIGGDPTYDYCQFGSDCFSDQLCLEVGTNATLGAFCSGECFRDDQCWNSFGFFGACMNVDGLGGVCFQECDFNSDCVASSGCYDFEDADFFLNRVCLPEVL